MTNNKRIVRTQPSAIRVIRTPENVATQTQTDGAFQIGDGGCIYRFGDGGCIYRFGDGGCISRFG